MAKKRMIFLAIAVLCGFTPWFSLPKQSARGDNLAKLRFLGLLLRYSWLKSDYPQRFVSICSDNKNPTTRFHVKIGIDATLSCGKFYKIVKISRFDLVYIDEFSKLAQNY